MRYLKIGAACIAAGISMWLLVVAAEFATAPSPSEYGVAALKLQDHVSALVEAQWTRPESKPTFGDLAAFEKLTAAVAKIVPPDLHRQADLAREDANEWMTTSVGRDVAYIHFYNWLNPRIGETASRVAATVVFGPGSASANYHYHQARERELSMTLPTRLLALTRFHYAMALVLAGDKPAAVKQLIDVIKYTPDWAPVGLTYIIAGRADALNDPVFCEMFLHVGGSLEELRQHYSGDNQKTFLPLMALRISSSYPER